MCKIIAFSGGCHSGKTTTLLKAKEILESEGVEVVVLSELMREKKIDSIDDLRKDYEGYFEMQLEIIREKIRQEREVFRKYYGKNCVILIDRAITDSLFYFTFYVNKQALYNENAKAYELLLEEILEYADFAFRNIYNFVIEFKPIPRNYGIADTYRPNRSQDLSMSEYFMIRLYNDTFSDKGNNKLIRVNAIEDETYLTNLFNDIARWMKH